MRTLSSNQKWLTISGCLLAVFFLTACGSSKSSDGFGSSDAASTSTNNSTDAQAVCSQDVSGLSDLQVRLMQYVDPYGQTRSDLVRLQFKLAPSGWQSGNWDLSLYRWSAAADNSVSLDSSPLAYKFERKVASGFQLLTDYSYTLFNWTEIQQMGQYANIGTSSPQEFFNTASLLVNLRDATSSYQVLRVAFRNSSDGSVVKEVDLLIPTFQADPAKYNADSRHPISLQVLHPLRDKLGQNWTQNNYYEFARAFCF